MRLFFALVLVCLSACSAIPPSEVRSRDLAWLEGRWIGTTPEGASIEEIWSAPADGALRGEHRVVQDGEVILRSDMRILSNTNGVVLLGALEGSDARRYGLVEFRHRFARFRGTSFDYPGEIEFSRTGSSMTVTVRGGVGLRQVQEVVHQLQTPD